MLKLRIIPRLLVRKSSKTQNFSVYTTKKYANMRPMSNLESLVRILEAQEPEELAVMFRSGGGGHFFEELLQQIDSMAKILSTPLSVGGISSFDSISPSRLFNAGADKIILNSLLYTDPALIRSWVLEYGSQSISAAVDIKLDNGEALAKATLVGGESYLLKIRDWIELAVRIGVGELQICSIDYDGGHVPSIFLERLLPEFTCTGLPVVYGGGCLNTDAFSDAFRLGVAGVTAASFFLQKDQNLSELKAQLFNRGFPVRYHDQKSRID